MSRTLENYNRRSLRPLFAIAATIACTLCVRSWYERVYAPILAENYRNAIEQQKQHERDELREFVEARRHAVYEQTNQLPPVDRVHVFLLGHRIVPDDQGFFVRSDGKSVAITREIQLAGTKAEKLAQLWRDCKFSNDKWLCGHDPACGIRFFHRGHLIFETSLDWMCHTFYAFDGRSKYGMLHFHDSDHRMLDFLDILIPVSEHQRSFLNRTSLKP